jgi:hypothetical protein
MSACACAYPPPDERLKLAQVEEERGTKRLHDEGYIKFNFRAPAARKGGSE